MLPSRFLGVFLVKIISDRLIIRDHCTSDLETHHELLSDSEVMKFLPDIKTNNMEESKANLLNAISESKAPERKLYAFRIEDKITNEFIGEIGYTVTENTPFGKMVHLGYFVKQKHWNKGYITEAAKKVIEFAFRKDNVYRIHTGCAKENFASEKVMQKCGFTKEAEFKEYFFHEGKLRDRVEYRLLKHEWENQKTAKS